MNYSKQEVMQFIREEDVKFIRLAFCDVFGTQKNISILAEEISRAFEHGIAFDGSAIKGFGDETRSDLFLHPDPNTLTILPWRPEHGKVVRMYCDVTYPDGTPFECDTRYLLKQAVERAEKAGIAFQFGAEMEFYLFQLDEKGERTFEPFDQAGYMDIAPADRGENVRREICLTLEQMGIQPESSHHEEGPGQNEIDFRYSSPLSAADNAMTFRSAVQSIAYRNGIFADFSPKPLADKPGNGLHINFSIKSAQAETHLSQAIAGILKHTASMTAFFNSTENSYKRLGNHKAPSYISWGKENRSQLIRIPAADGEYRRAELRSPDPLTNPYVAFTLLIYAGLDGIENGLVLPKNESGNLFSADESALQGLEKLPTDFSSACKIAVDSDFIKAHIPQAILNLYRNR